MAAAQVELRSASSVGRGQGILCILLTRRPNASGKPAGGVSGGNNLSGRRTRQSRLFKMF